MWRNVADPVVGDGRWIALEHELWSYAVRNDRGPRAPGPSLPRRSGTRWTRAWPSGLDGADEVGPALIGLLLGLEMMRRVDPDALTDEMAVAALLWRGRPDPTERQRRDRDRRSRASTSWPPPGAGACPTTSSTGCAGRRPCSGTPSRTTPGFWAVTKHADVVAVSRDSATYSSRARRHLHPDPGRGGAGSAAPDDPEHGPAQAPPVPATGVPGLHAADDRRAGRGDRPPGRPGSSTRSASRARCEFVEEIAAQVPVQMICEMIGLEPEQWPRMFELCNQLIGSRDDPDYAGSRTR